MSGTIEIYRHNRCENVIPLDQDEIIIGRDRYNRICLPDLGVSRSHAKIKRIGSAWYFEDHSSNGTSFNGEFLRRQSRPLEHGTTMVIGDFYLYYNALASGSDPRRTQPQDDKVRSDMAIPKFTLHFIPEKRAPLEIEGSYLTLGSDKRNHVRLEGSGISAVHACITVIDKVPLLFSYQDSASVNGAALERFPVVLGHGDIVTLGGVRFSFHHENNSDEQYKYKIVTNSRLMRNLIDQVDKTAKFQDIPVLLIGETGTGKELFAKAIHAVSPRVAKNFIAVNCAALSPSLAESLLFGHVKGSFTSAVNDHEGYFPRAHGGTLFLDEIGELPTELQSKLLRAIEYKQICRVGSSEVEEVDVRIITATNRELHIPEARKRSHFREDLYFRLRGFLLNIPPLRERSEDIPLLMDHFLKISKAKYPTLLDVKFTQKAYQGAAEYHWPGNVRELFQVCLSAFLHAEGPFIGDLPIFSPKDILPYENDIPQKLRPVYHLLCAGMNPHQISEELKIARMTVYNWKNKIESILKKHGAGLSSRTSLYHEASCQKH